MDPENDKPQGEVAVVFKLSEAQAKAKKLAAKKRREFIRDRIRTKQA